MILLQFGAPACVQVADKKESQGNGDINQVIHKHGPLKSELGFQERCVVFRFAFVHHDDHFAMSFGHDVFDRLAVK